MNLKALREEVLAHGFDPNLFGSSRINRFLNDGQNLVCNSVNWFAEEATQDFNTVQGTSIYPWPANLAQVRSLRDTGRSLEFEQVSLRDIDRSGQQHGAPVYYAVDGPNVHVFPIPDGVYPLELRYWKLPDPMVADTDEPIISADWQHILWVYATFICYEAEDDSAMGQYWQGRFNNVLSQFASTVKFPTSDQPHQLQGMWEGDRVLSSGGWSLGGY